MQYNEVASMIEDFGYPFAYRFFPNETDKQPPFVVFWYDGIDDLKADNINYQRIVILEIRLYTDNKDFSAEANVESVLASHGIAYSKDEIYIESEHMYEIFYETEIVING